MKKAFVFFAATVTMMSLSCTKSSPVPQQTRTIAIDPLITKATETDFEEGDKVGVTITRGSESFAVNECMTHDGSKFTSDLIWYSEGQMESKFVAYYPYSESIPATFTVADDQSGAAYGTSDLMGAVKEDVVPQASVTMIFKHLLTHIVVSIDNQVGAKISEITLGNSILSGSVDMEEMKVTVDSEAAAADIKMHPVKADTTYAAIVIPQEVKFFLTIKVDGGRTITKTLTSTTLKAGGQYTINATIVPGDLSVSMSGEIQNWNDEGVISEKEVTFEEFDTYFIYDDERYNTVELPDGNKWMAENMRFVPGGKKISSTPGDGTGIWYPYTSDGTTATPKTDAASISAMGYLYDYKTLLGKDITADNLGTFEGCQGICPPGWHVPTRAEYFALCGNSNKSDYLDEPNGTKTDPAACFYDASYSAGTVGKFNDAGFNFPLTGTIANSIYNLLTIDSSVCSVEDYYGKARMTFLATSSPNSATKFFGVMTTFTSANNQGKVSLSHVTLDKGAVVLRCVKTKNN